MMPENIDSAADCVRVDGWLIDNVRFGEAVERITRLSQAEEPSLVVTTNSNHLRMLRENAVFRSAYERATMRLADGKPLVWASQLAGAPLYERVTGSDIELAMCERLEGIGGHVIYLGGKTDDINRAAVHNRQAMFPDLKISGKSPSMSFGKNADETRELLEFIRSKSTAGQATVLFVCAGAPTSEIWAASNLRSEQYPEGIPQGVVVPVGAAVDFAAGIRKRAGEGLQKTGLEWAHRISQEPSRLGPRYWGDAKFLAGLFYRSLLQRRDNRRQPRAKRNKG